MTIQVIGILKLFVSMVVLMMTRELPTILALPITAVGIALIARTPFIDGEPSIARNVLEMSSMRMSTIIAELFFGGFFGKILSHVDIINVIIREAAEMADDKPLPIAYTFPIVTSTMFATSSGLGMFVLVGTIIVPIMVNAGLNPPVAGAILLLGNGIGVAFSVGVLGVYIDTLGLPLETVTQYSFLCAALLIVVSVIVIYMIIKFGNKKRRAWATPPSGMGSEKNMRSITLVSPLIPVVLISALKPPLVPAILVGIALTLVLTTPRNAVHVTSSSFVEGTRETAGTYGLVIGVDIALKAAMALEVVAILEPVIKAVIPSSAVMFILVSELLSPLTVYYRSLNVWGLSSGIMTLLTSCGMNPVAVTMALRLDPNVQAVRDSTNSHSIWMADSTKTDANDFLEKTILQAAVSALMGFVVVSFVVLQYSDSSQEKRRVHQAMREKVRVGIDVGGTSTNTVVVDSTAYNVIAKKKIPTTYKKDVAVDVTTLTNQLVEGLGTAPEDVVFIAHDTTQATNTLLGDDVVSVGTTDMRADMDAREAGNETSVGNIEPAPGKSLRTSHTFLDSRVVNDGSIRAVIDEVRGAGAEVIVTSEVHNMDNPEHELAVQETTEKRGLYCTGGREISQLYSLKMRTRITVINASLIPKMMEAANMTKWAVINTHIQSGLVIIWCDGDVVSVSEVGERPVLTTLSSLAARVIGALMYKKASSGVSFETSGTSMDISVIKNGKVMMKYTQVGEHRTYLQSLDVRTLGMADDSMVQINDGRTVDIGPRPIRIIGKEYECFQEDGTLDGAEVLFVSPRADDPKKYVLVQNPVGKKYSLILAGAANLLGCVPKEDYTKDRQQPTRAIWNVLEAYLGCVGEETARKTMDSVMDKLVDVAEELIDRHELDTELATLVGGDGSEAVIVHALAEWVGVRSKIVKNTPYIPTIGVALAMVRGQMERTIANPTEEDVKKIRQDIIEKVMKSDANEKTVDVTIEVDAQESILRAITAGTTELQQKSLGVADLRQRELRTISSETLEAPKEKASCVIVFGRWNIYKAVTRKKMLGFFSQEGRRLCVIDREDVIGLKRERTEYLKFVKGRKNNKFAESLNVDTTFSDVNATAPEVFIFYREKILDLIGMQSAEQLNSILDMKIGGLEDSEGLIMMAYKQETIYIEGGERK